MPKLKVNGKDYNLKDGESLKKYCEEAGIMFGCEDGHCGTCLIEVKKGKENLKELNDKELDLGLESDGKYRLACQCKIHGKENAVVKCEGYI